MPREDILRLAVCSNLRRDLLINLKEGKKPLTELRDELEVNSATAIQALVDLEKSKLVYQDEALDYALTKIGEIMTLKLADFLDAIEILQKYEKFWCEHDISDIPSLLLEQIGDLRNSMPLVGTSTSIFKLHSTFLRVLETANEVKGIYSIFDIEYLTTIRDLVKKKKIDVYLIVTNGVLESIKEVIKTEAAFKDLLQEPNLTLCTIDEEVKLTLTLTDSIFYLGLFAQDGLYDYNRALISIDEKTLSWGRKLHEHYRKRAKKVDLGI